MYEDFDNNNLTNEGTLNLTFDNTFTDNQIVDIAPKTLQMSELLSVLVERWLKTLDAKPSSIEDARQTLAVFLDILEQYCRVTTVGDLDVKAVNTYVDVLLKMPRNPNRNRGKLTLKAFLESEHGLKPASKSTAHKAATWVRSFIQFLGNRDLLDDSKLVRTLKTVKRPKLGSSHVKKVLGWKPEDLQALFNPRELARLKNDMPWAMRLALFHGMRMAEILSLTNEQIIEFEGRPAFNLGVDRNDDLKENTSIGLVPIHPAMWDMGFQEYLDCRPDRLFPDEKRNSRGEFSAFVNRFATHRKRVDLYVPGKSFHSFRHTLRTALVDIRCPEFVVDAILRHANPERSVGSVRYTHVQRWEEMCEWMDRVQFDIPST